MLPVTRRPSVPVPSFFSPERPGCVVVIDQDHAWADGLCGALGQGRPAEIAAGRRAGCDTCLARPASFAALREIVRQVAR
ncbi:MAG: hypothetical protein ACK5PW_20185 [Burkholderiales bacterium]